MDKAQEKVEIITTLFTAYGQGSDGTRIAAYVAVLSDIPVNILSLACKKLMLESKFLPSISEIVTATRSIVGAITGSGMKTWDEAWEELQAQRRIAFIYEKPAFSTEEIALTAKRYGWKEFCEAREEDYNIVQAQVRNIYLGICRAGEEKQINNHVLRPDKIPTVPLSDQLRSATSKVLGVKE